VALAYAQVVSFIHFLRRVRGPDSLNRLIELVEGGTPASDALREVGGEPFDRLYARWKEWLGEFPLDPIPGLRVLPRKPSEGGENTGRSSDLSGVLPYEAHRFVRLGDMLRDRSRPAAAAIEYRKAIRKTDYISPHLRVRIARMEIRSDQLPAAEKTLRRMARFYPDHLPLYLARAELHRRRDRDADAAKALETAVHINPFDPRVHRGLAILYGRLDRPRKHRREEKVLGKLYEWLGW
jgi:tetratricopeptide (TPR) repeat protein